MGLFIFLFVLLAAYAVSAWSGSLLLGIVVAITGFAVLSPTPKRPERRGSLFTTLLCLVGLYWLFGGDDEA